MVDNFYEFLHLMENLKHLPRTGWVLRGVPGPVETVAAHMYRMAMMTYALPPDSPLNRLKCMELCLVHDMAECVVGDITPHCGVSKEEKQSREIEAMVKITGLMGINGSAALELFKEYEDRSTPESKFVKELDLLDMRLQAFEYEQKNHEITLQEFFDSTEGQFSDPFILQIVHKLDQDRNSFKEKSTN